MPYVVLNSDGLINQVNRMGGRLMGVSTTSMAGSEFAKLIPSRHHHAFKAFWKEAWREPTVGNAPLACEVPMVMVRPRGRLIDVRMTAIMFAREGVGTLLVALEDITARKLYENELQHSERALILADRNKNDFIAALSHEMRNPLSPICSSLEILSAQQSITDAGERALGVIRRQVDHMNYLVNELLDVSHISRAKVQLNLERTSMTRIVRQTVDDYRAFCQAQRIALEVDADTGIWVDGDETRLVQIVSNLLADAVKFTPVGERIVTTLKACDDASMPRPVSVTSSSAADDNVDTADSLCDILRLRGRRAEPAYDGRSGLDTARRHMPDAVICDIGLPVMDGYAVAQNIRADESLKHIHLIALTGYACADDIARAKNAGFNNHLSKPYNSDALTHALDGLQQRQQMEHRRVS